MDLQYLTILLIVLLAGSFSCSGSLNAHSPSHSQRCSHHLKGCLGTQVCVRSTSVLASMLIPATDFLDRHLEAAVKLGLSATQHSTPGIFDLVLLQLEDQRLPIGWEESLVHAGWQICTVKPIEPRERDSHSLSVFRDQFVKLRLWNFVEYSRVVFMNPDCLVVGNIDALFDDPASGLGSSSFSAAQNLVNGKWTSGFSTGVFVLTPSAAEYRRLMDFYEESSKTLNFKMSHVEQGFLNHFFRDRWTRLNPRYGASLTIYAQRPDIWDKLEADLRVIHYTLVKPWRCEEAAFAEICALWTDFPVPSRPCKKRLSVCAEEVCVYSEQALFALALPSESFDSTYLQGALKLAVSAKMHSTVQFDLVALQLASKPLLDDQIAALKSKGYQVCTVPPIVPPRVDQVLDRFRDQFAKLHIWAMEEYKRSVYLDGDCLVVGNIDPLFNMDISPHHFAATFDREPSGQRPTFNMGVFVVEPQRTEFSRFMNLLEADSVDHNRIMAEQGFLNAVLASEWFELPFIFNANMASYGQHVWKSQEENIRVIHFTMKKPWDCDEAICQRWKELNISKQ